MMSERKDRKHVCDCPDRTADRCPRHGAVAPCERMTPYEHGKQVPYGHCWRCHHVNDR